MTIEFISKSKFALNLNLANSIIEYGYICFINNNMNSGKIDLNTVEYIQNHEFVKYINELALIEKSLKINSVNNDIQLIFTEFTNTNYSEFDQLLMTAFNISIDPINAARKMSKTEFEFQQNFTLIIKRMFKVSSINVSINSEEDYIAFIKMVNPLDLVYATQLKPELSLKDINNYYDYIVKLKANKQLIALAYDQCISTSHFGTVNYTYVDKVLANWLKKELKTVEEAINYLKEMKNAIADKENKFVEPEYEQIVDDKKSNDDDVDRLKQLLTRE